MGDGDASDGTETRPRGRAVAGTLLFLVVVPGTVAGLVPWLITGWETADVDLPGETPLRLLGGGFVVVGTLALLHAFARFALDGLGTPSPTAPTESLVVTGLYRYVRNPMYVAVGAVIAGQALILLHPGLLAYLVVYCAAVASFVQWYEQPTLLRRFGASYERYRRAVPAWWPRLTPWQPDPHPDATPTAP